MLPQLLFESSVLRLSHDALTDWLYVEWRGAIQLPAVQEGCAHIVAQLRQRGIRKILCDNTLVATPSPDSLQWAARHWLPQVRAAGLRYVAWVYSGKIANRATFDQLQPYFTATPVVAAFDEVASAYEWLRQQPAPPELGQ